MTLGRWLRSWTDHGYRCSLCGKEMTCQIADIEEDEPSIQANNRRWRTWKISKISKFCDEHKRAPIVKYNHGTAEEIAESEATRIWNESLRDVLR